jgi:hypothetical protein
MECPVNKLTDMKLTPFRHYILYAKGHYKRTDLFSDLHAIQCNYVGCEKTADLTLEDMIRVTSRAVYSVFGDIPVERYSEYILEYGRLYQGGFRYEYANLREAMILANLGILRHATIDDIARRNGECLGNADFTILPKAD